MEFAADIVPLSPVDAKKRAREVSKLRDPELLRAEADEFIAGLLREGAEKSGDAEVELPDVSSEVAKAIAASDAAVSRAYQVLSALRKSVDEAVEG